MKTMQHLLSDKLLAPQKLALATALPALFYTDTNTPQLDVRAVFSRSWQWVCHQSQIADAGDYIVTTIAGLPLIILRSVDGSIKAFHNVCRHRAGPIATCDAKQAKVLRCKYHGWTYGLDGVLRSAPEMTNTENFTLSDIKLPEAKVAVWQGLVFVAADDAPKFLEVIDGIDERLGQQTLQNYVFHRRVGYDINCNWKVYVDNYLEGYHVPHIHPGLNSLLDYRTYITETAEWYSYQFSPLESADDLYGSGDALYYFIYPNTMLNILPGRLQTNRVIPLDVNKCRVEFDYYYAADDSDKAAQRRERDLAFSDEVQKEDVDICESVQIGLSSGSYTAGRLNPLRENAVHHFHELLRSAYSFIKQDSGQDSKQE